MEVGDRANGLRLTLAILFLVATINFLDRHILIILLEPIRKDLGLTDTQLGLLTGIAFALFFAVAGMPIARLAETGSRRWIIAASLGAWSLFTAACGLAQGFVQLMVLRILVAVGESGSGPASQSMIADLVPHGRRAAALAVLACGVPAGVLIGLAAGGLLNEWVGWQSTFLIVGLPGLVLAGFVILAIQEPKRLASAQLHSRRLWPDLGRILSIRSYRLIAVAAALHLFAIAGFNQWIGAYLIRTYALGTAEVGLWLGLILGIVGGFGTLTGGYLGDRLGRRHPGWFGWFPALVAVAGLPPTIGLYFAAEFEMALLFLVGPVLSATLYLGPVMGAVQSLSPPELRTTAAAMTILLGGVIGQAGGPLMVGVLSDQFAAIDVGQSLRWALVAIAPISFLAGGLFWLAGRSMRDDLAQAEPGLAPKAMSA